MDTAARFKDQSVFFLTGKRSGDGLGELTGDFLPALFAPFRDLTRLRYDYPVVLVTQGAGPYVVSLSETMSAVVAATAPRGIEGERLRRQLLRVERELRVLAAAGRSGALAELWPVAADAAARGDAVAQDLLRRCAEALPVDGELVDCDAALAPRLLKAAWDHAQAERATRFRARADRLTLRLSDILRAARAHSQAGRQPAELQASFGSLHGDAFDFAALARYLGRNQPVDELPAARRRRIEWALAVLTQQRFYPSAAVEPYAFVFDNCADAIAAHRERLPRLLEVVKALAIADLESQGAYVEAEHDAFFERFDADALTADEIAQFPHALVCIAPAYNDAPENAALLEMLSAGMPVKVLVQQTDLLEDSTVGHGRFAFGVRSARLATTAMSLGGLYVLQSTSSNLYALRDRVHAGMAARGPALFCVYAGVPPQASALPPYLTAAAAMKSRAFAAFTYDAAAGSNWATRFSLENNRDPRADWAVEALAYADDGLQRAETPLHFTYADFLLCDRRAAHHFAVVPRDRWSQSMLPAADWLTLSESDAAERLPYVLAIDAADRLHRVLVDHRLIQATRRCLLLWQRLQEHGGVNAPPPMQPPEPAVGTPPETPAAAPEAAPTQPAPAAAPPARTSDDPWIETARCSSCNECQVINDRLFGYNENQQAYIKDARAGTYRQIVEAAEACQVAIIHPGQPLDPNEPGLEELRERARPFQ